MDVSAQSIKIDADTFVLSVMASSVHYIWCRRSDRSVKSDLLTSYPFFKSRSQEQMPQFPLCLVYRMAPLGWCLSRLHGRDAVTFFQAGPPGIEALQSNMPVQVFVIVAIAEGLKTVYT